MNLGFEMKFVSLAYRFVVWFIMVALLPLALFGYLSLRQHEAELRLETLSRMARLADKKTLELKTYLAERRQDAQLLARNNLVEKAMSEVLLAYTRYGVVSAEYRKTTKPFNRDFGAYIGADTLYYDVFLISPQGDIIYTHKHEPDFATNLASGPYRDSQLAQAFQESRATLESSFSDFEYYSPSKRAAAFVSAPIIREGVLLGVIALQLDIQRVYQVAMENAGLGATGETALAKLTGVDEAVFVAPLRRDSQAAMQRKIDLMTTGIPMRHALAGQRGSGIEIDYSGKQVVAAWRYLPELRWGIVVKMDADEAFAPLYQQRKNLLEALLALTAMGGFFAFYFGRQMVARLRNCAGKADEIAQGDLNKRVDESGADEISALARSFNHMTVNLQAMYRTLEERVEERTRELSVNNEQLQGEIKERKKAEKALRESRQLLEAIVEHIPVMVFVKRASDLRFELFNRAGEKLLGYSCGDLLGKGDYDLWHREQSDWFTAADRKALASEDVTEIPEEPIKTASGEICYLRTWKVALHDEGGEPAHLLGISIDITEIKRTQLELQHNQDLLNEAQRLGHLGSWELNLQSGESRWSDEVFRIFELDPMRFLPTYENFMNMIHPDDRDKVNQAYTQSLESQQTYDIVHRLQLADGRIKWVREHCSSEFDASGKPLRSMGAVQDITAQKLAEDALRVAAATFETHEAILITDANANIIRVNQAFTDITGYSQEDVVGKNPRILSSGRQNKTFYAEMWRQLLHDGMWAGEIWDRRKSGRIYPKRMTITAIKDEQGVTTEYVAIFSDITARKQAEEEIRNLAFYDALTTLPNRRLLLDRLQLARSVSARSHHYGAVLFLDMDKFKMLNDTLGHNYGDLLLVEVAKRIQSCVRERDTVARLGGDEFVVLIEEIDANAEGASQKVALVAEKIRASLSAPYRLKDHVCHSSPSIGVCLYLGNEESVDALLKYADLAMYQVKATGRNAVRFFDPAMQKAVEMHATLDMDLRHAVPDHQLRLYYQIQLNNDLRPLGAEALVRWVHPKNGMVSPMQFIPIAEESSLILDIGHWVLKTACQQLALWRKREQTRDLVIAVNVSAQEFRLHDFVDRVAAVVRAHQVDPSRLKLELTESVVLDDVANIVTKMHALKAMGIRLSLDDFGTGYSSLAYLKKLPLDQIKIDQSFVRDIATDINDAVMVKTIIDMAKNFRLNIIAEGVETEAQLAFLKENGCMAYQGFLFGKPMPIDEFEASLGGHWP